jgi:hypothetical protein
MSAQLSLEDIVRKFFDCYTNGRPEDFDEVVAPDYLDYGRTPQPSLCCAGPRGRSRPAIARLPPFSCGLRGR